MALTSSLEHGIVHLRLIRSYMALWVGKRNDVQVVEESRLRADRCEASGDAPRRACLQRQRDFRGVRDFGDVDGQGAAETGAPRGRCRQAWLAMLGGNDPVARQSLQNLGHQRRRNPVLLGNLAGAASMHAAVRRQMLHSDQPVICFLRQLEHRSASPPTKPYTTESVANEQYHVPRKKSKPCFQKRSPKPLLSFILH